MAAIHQYCRKQKEPTVVFYFHNKGASRYKADWRKRMGRRSKMKYGHSLYWRKYLEYFTIERPGICIDRIVNGGASTCGANLCEHKKDGDHYSGTFWSASCEYISSLRPLNMSAPELSHFAAEFWIGSKFTKDRNKFVDLHSRYKKGYCGGHLYYYTPIEPETYSDYAYRWQNESYKTA